MAEVVVADIGGTHARFALAEVQAGRVLGLGEPMVLRTADHATFEDAWRAFGASLGRPPPRAASVAMAGPTTGEVLKFTNNAWSLDRRRVRETLTPEGLMVLNDFGAVAHAVAQLGQGHFERVCGPEGDLGHARVITIVGPGTGLGVAQLVRRGDETVVVETEGGHIGFAPSDRMEDRLLAHLRERHGRVSVERLLSGPGLAAIYTVISGGEPAVGLNDLWSAALDDEDPAAAAALERFCAMLGGVAGDLALAHGAEAVVIAGGLGARLRHLLPASGFCDRFAAKGRHEARMRAIPIQVIVHPQPGLFGAAAAFAQEHP